MRQGTSRIKRTLPATGGSGPKVKDITAGSGTATSVPRKLSQSEELVQHLRSELRSASPDAAIGASPVAAIPELNDDGMNDGIQSAKQVHDLENAGGDVQGGASDHVDSKVTGKPSPAVASSTAISSGVHESRPSPREPVAPNSKRPVASSRYVNGRFARAAPPNRSEAQEQRCPPSMPSAASRRPRGAAQVDTNRSAASQGQRVIDQSHERAQKKTDARQKAHIFGRAQGRLAQLVAEVNAHFADFTDPLDNNGWLQETAQLELFAEEMRWLICEHGKRDGGLGVCSEPEGSAVKHDIGVVSGDKDLGWARQQLRRCEHEHRSLLQRLSCVDPEQAAELKNVEEEIATEKKRQKELIAENRRRERELGRNVVDGVEIDAATRAEQLIERLEAELGVWKVKNSSLHKQVHEATQLLHRAWEKRKELAEKTQRIQEILNSDEYAAQQAEQQKAEERIRLEEIRLQEQVAELREARQRALKDYRRRNRDETRQFSDLLQAHKELEDRERESAGVMRMLQRQLRQAQYQQVVPTLLSYEELQDAHGNSKFQQKDERIETTRKPHAHCNFSGDFRSLPAAAWVKIHSRFDGPSHSLTSHQRQSESRRLVAPIASVIAQSRDVTREENDAMISPSFGEVPAPHLRIDVLRADAQRVFEQAYQNGELEQTMKNTFGHIQ